MCVTKGCRKPKKTGRYCYSCAKRRYAEANPERYAFSVLKNNAKRRGKPFEITFDYFKRFVKRHHYIAGKGTSKDGLHVDRKDETRGYVPGNLQVLTNSDNVKKYLAWDQNERGKPVNFKVKKAINYTDIDAPF